MVKPTTYNLFIFPTFELPVGRGAAVGSEEHRVEYLRPQDREAPEHHRDHQQGLSRAQLRVGGHLFVSFHVLVLCWYISALLHTKCKEVAQKAALPQDVCQDSGERERKRLPPWYVHLREGRRRQPKIDITAESEEEGRKQSKAAPFPSPLTPPKEQWEREEMEERKERRDPFHPPLCEVIEGTLSLAFIPRLTYVRKAAGDSARKEHSS